MAKYVLGEAPYYNGFNPDKHYESVLFRPGMVVQTQELNELQSILKQSIKNIGGVLLTDGDIIDGCQCAITDLEDNAVAKKATITEGRIYLDGNVYDVDRTELTLKGTGTEVIGVKLVEEVITEKEDASLLDNSAGYANAQMSGAHRLKSHIEITLDDENSSVLYNVFDGVVVTESTTENSESTIINKISTTLARRTYDESGNYRVDGLQISAKGMSDEDYIMLTISAGKAYIKGNELTRDTAVTLALKRATDLRSIELESQEYSTGTTNYPLNNNPVIKDGLVVDAYVQATTTITKGVAGGSDPFPAEYTTNSIASIIEVKDSVHGNYEIGRNGDCYRNGNSVKWNEGASQPSNGSTYTVTFSYVKTLRYGIDYDLVVQNEQYYIRFLNVDGSVKPMDATNLMIRYQYMLYRRDLIIMDYLGNIKVLQGQSDDLSTVASPVLADDDSMVLGSVLLTPLSDTLGIINNTNKRLSMNELQSIANRLSNVEQNIAISDLDNEAIEGEDASSLIGVYTDGFIGLTKCDVDHKLFNCAVDLDNQELTLAAQETLHELIVENRSDLSPVSSYKKYGSLITAPCVETKIAGVDAATGVKAVNPYAVFSGMPIINISPRQNNWIDTKSITVQGSTVTRTVTLRRWWYHTTESWAETEKAQYIALGFKDGGKSLGWNAGTVTQTYSAVASVLDTAIKYMQQIKITVVGQMFNAYTDNIQVNFNGIKVNITPSATLYTGTLTGTLRADKDGYTKGTFMVPENTLCGTVEVQMYPYGDDKRIASTSFTSNGTLRTTTKVVWKEITKVNPTDPLAQTFQFEDDQLVTSVGVYFFKSDGLHDVSIQIRGVTNGYPNQTCYAEKILHPSDISVSDTGTKETRVEFDDPVYCKKDVQYCFVVLTESTTDSVFYSELGGKDVRTNVQLLKNPYAPGMMFSSSNAITWTAHQGCNLKFNIYGNQYDTGYVYFAPITKVSYDRIMGMADVSTPDGTELIWEYSNDGGVSWLPLVIYNDMELSKLINQILIRVKLVPTKTVSPVILTDSCYFIGFVNNTVGNYVSRNVAMDGTFTNVKQIISVYDPDNSHTSMAVYYAVDVDGDSWKSPTQKGKKVLGNGWYQYTFEDEVSSGAKNFRARVYMTTNDSTVRPRLKNLMNIMT